jgi:hypothetical protein
MTEVALLTRDEARRLGEVRFFTGRPCKNGHTAERHTRGNRCVVCVADAVKRFEASDHGKAQRARHKRKYATKTEVREKLKGYKAKFLATPKGRASIQRDQFARRMRRYGLSAQEFHDLVAGQGGLCAVCGRAFADLPAKQVAIDHCHCTSRVRGILCQACNTMLGHARDSADILRKGAAYLETNTTEGSFHPAR